MKGFGKGFGKNAAKSSKKRKAKAPEIEHLLAASNRFSIAISQLTGNYLIVIDNSYCYDSAMKLPDAEKVLKQVIEYEKTHPLPNSSSHEHLHQWTAKTIGYIDDVPAIGCSLLSIDEPDTLKKIVVDVDAMRRGLSPFDESD